MLDWEPRDQGLTGPCCSPWLDLAQRPIFFYSKVWKNLKSLASSHKLEDRAGHRRLRQDGKFKSSMSYKIRLLKKSKSNEIRLHANESLSSVFHTAWQRWPGILPGLIPLLGPASACQTGCPRTPLSSDKEPRELGSLLPLLPRPSPHIPAYRPRNKTL